MGGGSGGGSGTATYVLGECWEVAVAQLGAEKKGDIKRGKIVRSWKTRKLQTKNWSFVYITYL